MLDINKLQLDNKYHYNRITIISLLGMFMWVAIMVSNQSLWIDEALTAIFAKQDDLSSWWKLVKTWQLSDVQMPLYMFLAFIWGKLLGYAEWQLRLPNLIYAWGGLSAFWLLGRRRGLPILPFLAASSPFLAYYINEARPYALLMGFGAWLLYAYFEINESSARNVNAFALFVFMSVLLCATHMLAIFCLIPLTIILAWIWWREKWIFRLSYVFILAFGLVFMIILGGYYAWTLSRNVEAARLWPVGLGNVSYALYEFSGLSAFGPPRLLIREAMHQGNILKLASRFLPGLLIALPIYGWLALRYWRSHGNKEVAKMRLGLITVLTMGIMLISALIVKWPFWGRHLAPIFPFALLLVVAKCHPILQQPGNIRFSILGLVLLALWMAGSLNQRFSPTYAKDDYRSACQIACNALEKGQTVWWAANAEAARDYYEPRFTQNLTLDLSQRIFIPTDATENTILNYPKPRVVVLSKPDIYDRDGYILKYLQEHSAKIIFRLTAFQIFSLP